MNIIVIDSQESFESLRSEQAIEVIVHPLLKAVITYSFAERIIHLNINV